MGKNNYEGIHPYVVNQVRYHARSLMRHSAIHDVEIEDLEQELMLDYLSRKQAYDPEKAKWSTFVDRILNHKCASLIEAARAQKRGQASVTFHSMHGLRIMTTRTMPCIWCCCWSICGRFPSVKSPARPKLHVQPSTERCPNCADR